MIKIQVKFRITRYIKTFSRHTFLMSWKLHLYTYLYFCQTTINFAAPRQGEIFSFDSVIYNQTRNGGCVCLLTKILVQSHDLPVITSNPREYDARNLTIMLRLRLFRLSFFQFQLFHSFEVACVAGGISALNAVWSRPARRISGGVALATQCFVLQISQLLACCIGQWLG